MALQNRSGLIYYKRRFYELEGAKGVIITGNGKFANRKSLNFINSYGGALYFAEIPLPKIQQQLLAPLLPMNEMGSRFAKRTIELYQAAKFHEKPIELRHLRSIAAHFHFYSPHFSGWTGGGADS